MLLYFFFFFSHQAPFNVASEHDKERLIIHTGYARFLNSVIKRIAAKTPTTLPPFSFSEKTWVRLIVDALRSCFKASPHRLS